MSNDEETTEQLDEQIAAAAQELESLNVQAEAVVADDSTGTDLVPVAKSAEAARQQLAQQRASAIKIRREVQAKAKALSELQRRKLRAVERQMQRELARMDRMLAPLQEQLERLEEAVWTVNLYLGRDEQIVRLHKGKPAPADAPVVVRQLVLAMDQECAVAAEQGGIDSLDHEEFDRWLQEDWAHVEQVIPEPKGVVALVPRWNERMKHYESDAMTRAAADGNDQTYFLVRNGEQLYRTWTDFQIGKTLVPTTDEFTSYFMQRKSFSGEMVAMEPGSREWLAAEKAAGRKQRDYMRVALILEGLLHRTTVFHPLPEQGISFTDQRFHQAGVVRFIHDAERTLGTGREPFVDWQRRLMADVHKGMRVVGNFSGQDWRYADSNRGESYSGRYGHSRVRPGGASHPQTGAIYRVEDVEGRDLIIRYARTDEVWDRDTWSFKRPERRASAVLNRDDEFIIPFDLVSAEECETYLSARLEREEYVSMFPVLKAVVRAKRAEDAVEAPLRTMLTGVLARETGRPVAEVEAALPDLVRWYKLANRIHRPVITGNTELTNLPPGMDEDDVELVLTDPDTGNADGSKAVRLIVAEYRRRLRDAEGSGNDAEARQRLLELHPGCLLIARLRRGGYAVLEAADERNVYVHRTEYSLTGLRKAEPRERVEWVLPGARRGWIVLHESGRWGEWDLAADPGQHLTAPEAERLRERVLAAADREPTWLALTTYEGPTSNYGLFQVWTLEQPGEVDWQHLLTGDVQAPRVMKRPVRWHRDKGGAVRWSEEYGWHEEVRTRKPKPGHKTDASVRDETVVKPWEHERHGDKYTAFWEHEERVGELLAAHARFIDAKRRRAEMAEVVDAAVESLRVQWLQPRYDAAYRKFLEDYGDAELWEGHLKANSDYLPGWPHAERRHYGAREDTSAWMRSLRVLVQANIAPWGKTVQQVVDEARQDEAFPWDMREERVPREHRGSKSWGSNDPLVPMEERVLEVPDELASMVFTEGLTLVEPWPDPDAEDDDDEPDEVICDGCGEPEEFCECEQPEFDVEGEVEQEALPAGDDGTTVCAFCGERKADPDEFHDGARCNDCAAADEEAEELDDADVVG